MFGYVREGIRSKKAGMQGGGVKEGGGGGEEEREGRRGGRWRRGVCSEKD